MTLPDVTVLAQFTNPLSADFIFDGPTGIFDGGLFAGSATTDLSTFTKGTLSIRRGRSNALDNFSAGQATITLEDPDRRFDASNVSSPYVGELGPGRQFIIQSHGVTIFTGSTTGYTMSDETSFAYTDVVVTLEDLLGPLGRRPMTEWTTTSQLPGERINAVLNRAEVDLPVAQRDIGVGVSVLQGDNVSAGSSTVNYLQLVAASDMGRLFASRVDVLVFQDRVSAAVTPITVRIMDAPTLELDVEPARVTRSNTIRDQYNRVTVDRVGGIAQSAALASAVILAQGGVRTLSRSGLLLVDDAASQAMADWLLAIYSEARNRVSDVVVNLAPLPLALTQALLGIELGDRVTMIFTPNGVGAAVTVTLAVESLTHSISAFAQSLTLGVSVVDNSTPFVFDDVTFGTFDGPGLFIF